MSEPTAGLLASQFKPATKTRPKDGSPFYSHNLHRYLKDNSRFNRIFSGVIGDGADERKELFIGSFFDGAFIGMELNRVLTSHKGRFELTNHSHRYYRTDEWEDITETFIEAYTKYGRCALHDFDHQWDLSKASLESLPYGATRRCLCCGAVEEKVKVTTYALEITQDRPSLI